MTKITDLTAASALLGDEAVEVSQVSTTVAITAATISAAAADNSYNDSVAGFVAAGFAVDDRVRVTGFTGNVANNIYTGVVTAVTAGKITIGGTDGDVIVDEAEGDSVTIAKWVSRRAVPGDFGEGVTSILKVLARGSVIDAILTAPPGSPSEEDSYIVAASATGDWAGQDNAIAIYVDSAWEFHAPVEGWFIRDQTNNVTYQFAGAAWAEFSSGAGTTYLDRVLIDGAVIDASLATPPGSPTDGDAYIVAATATGDWAGQEDKIAIYEDTAWAFYTPAEGYILRDQADDLTYQFDGLVWAEFNLGSFFTTIVNSDAPSGYQIVGDVLMCWGLDQQTGAPRTITFPKAFKTGTTPRMTTGTRVNAARFITVEAIDATSADITAYTDTGGSSNAECMWLAIGEAADADKMPKEVGGVTEITVDNNGLELIGVYDLSTFTLDSGNELEVNVEAYSQLIVDVQAATFGTADIIRMQASDDGGATYFTGGTDYERWNFYESGEAFDVDTDAITIAPSGTTSITGYWMFTGLNNSDTGISGFGFTGSTRNYAQRQRLQAANNGVNYLKFFSSSGNAATGGKLLIYGVPKGPESRQALGFVERSYVTKVDITADKSSANFTTPAVVSWDAEDLDEGGLWDVGDPTKFVVPDGVSVQHLAFTGRVVSNGAKTSHSDYAIVHLYKNGASVTSVNCATRADYCRHAFAFQGIKAEPGDEFEIYFQYGADTTVSIRDTSDCFVTMTLLEAENGYKKPTITTTTPLTLADVPALAEIDTSAGNLTVTLPPNAPQGTIWNGIIIDATNVVTVSAPSGENLDGVTDGSGDMTQALGAEASFRKTSVGWFSTGDMGVVS